MQGREYEMASERGLNGNLRGLDVARFTDHDPVRILTQKGAQHAAESQSDAFIDRDLHDPFDIILDRVLGCEQLRIDRIYFV